MISFLSKFFGIERKPKKSGGGFDPALQAEVEEIKDQVNARLKNLDDAKNGRLTKDDRDILLAHIDDLVQAEEFLSRNPGSGQGLISFKDGKGGVLKRTIRTWEEAKAVREEIEKILKA